MLPNPYSYQTKDTIKKSVEWKNTQKSSITKLNLAAELEQVAVQPKNQKLSLPTCCKEQAVKRRWLRV